MGSKQSSTQTKSKSGIANNADNADNAHNVNKESKESKDIVAKTKTSTTETVSETISVTSSSSVNNSEVTIENNESKESYESCDSNASCESCDSYESKDGGINISEIIKLLHSVLDPMSEQYSTDEELPVRKSIIELSKIYITDLDKIVHDLLNFIKKNPNRMDTNNNRVHCYLLACLLPLHPLNIFTFEMYHNDRYDTIANKFSSPNKTSYARFHIVNRLVDIFVHRVLFEVQDKGGVASTILSEEQIQFAFHIIDSFNDASGDKLLVWVKILNNIQWVLEINHKSLDLEYVKKVTNKMREVFKCIFHETVNGMKDLLSKVDQNLLELELKNSHESEDIDTKENVVTLQSLYLLDVKCFISAISKYPGFYKDFKNLFKYDVKSQALRNYLLENNL